MSTSNIKTPLVPRIGYIDNWKSIEKGEIKNNLECELNKLNLIIINRMDDEKILTIIYYKLIQIQFQSYDKKRKNKKKKEILSFKLNSDNRKGKWIKGVRLSKNKKINILKERYEKSKLYMISELVKRKINTLIDYKKTIYLENIYGIMGNERMKLLDAMMFLITNQQLYFGKILKFSVDAVIICDVLRLGFGGSDVIVVLIKKALERNSKKGQQRKFLGYMQKVLDTMARKVAKAEWERVNLDLIIVVCGKFSATGRTQKFKIQKSKMPLHSLTTVYDFEYGFVNTKAGTFSIKVWKYK